MSLHQRLCVIGVILNVLWWVKECKSWNTGLVREPGRTKRPSWVFHNSDCLFCLQPLSARLHFPTSGADRCHVVRTSRWQKPGNEGPSCFSPEEQWTSSTCHNFTMQHKEGLVLLLIWQCFSCNVTYQISPISLLGNLLGMFQLKKT